MYEDDEDEGTLVGVLGPWPTFEECGCAGDGRCLLAEPERA